MHICDYEGSRYRTDFWEGQGREYENMAERIAIRRLLPPAGELLLEVGAGYGRLADLYAGYQRVVLLDYARSQLEEAQRYLGLTPDDRRCLLVVADAYHLPFVDRRFDAVVTVRVMHHMSDAPAALAEIHRVLGDDRVGVIEFANKRNLKALARWWLRRQTWNPHALEPVEFVPLNFNFHPQWMWRRLKEAGFALEAVRTVSHFRFRLAKRLLPPQWLAALDGLAQTTGRWWQLAPSVCVRVRARKRGAKATGAFFCCPICRSPDLKPSAEALICTGCGRGWGVRHGIYDFKTPL